MTEYLRCMRAIFDAALDHERALNGDERLAWRLYGGDWVYFHGMLLCEGERSDGR